MKFKEGDLLIDSYNGARFEVTGTDGIYYKLKYLSFDTHGSCLLRTAGREIEFVDKTFKPVSKLEKVLK